MRIIVKGFKKYSEAYCVKCWWNCSDKCGGNGDSVFD